MSSPTPGQSTPDPAIRVSPERRTLVEKARRGWIRRLIDLSRRNNLLYHRPLKTGTLDLADADPDRMAELLSGAGPVQLSKLLPKRSIDSMLPALRDISRRAQANAEERGLQTLFLALGLANWPADDGGRPPEAPIILVPVTLDAKTRGGFSVARAGNVQINLVLLHVLESQFGVKVGEEDLIPHLLGDDEGEPFDPNPLYKELIRRAADIPSFQVKGFAVIGNFAFQKMAMVKDLRECGEQLAVHDLVAAIAGDTDARSVVASAQQDFDAHSLDSIPPDGEFIVLDADSSQQTAIAGILEEQTAVVHGPPGTGKSQTIANLVASLAATGHKVLFVAEKRAALDVVLSRLKEIGLDHLAIDLHGADLSARRVMQQVAKTLDSVRMSVPPDCEKIHVSLVNRRQKLNEHVQRVHERREPTGMSVYEMEGKLLALGETGKCTTRWRSSDLNKLTPPVADRICAFFTEAGGFASLFLRNDPSPWTGAVLPDGAAVEHALDLVAKLVDVTFPSFRKSLQEILNAFQITEPQSIDSIKSLTELVSSLQGTLKKYSPDLFDEDLPHLIEQFSLGKDGSMSAAWAWVFYSEYRDARSRVSALRSAGKASAHAVFFELSEVSHRLDEWKKVAKIKPARLPHYKEQEAAFAAFYQDLANLTPILPSRKFNELTIAGLDELLRALQQDRDTPYEIPKLTTIERGLENAGVGKLVTEIRKSAAAADTWVRQFQFAWFASTMDNLSQSDPEIRGFKGKTHSQYVDDFTRLDEERIQAAADRVRRAHGLRAIEAMNAYPAEQQLIRAEAMKVRRHRPLRKVFAEASHVLTAVCPCWMASPLSVSQLLDSRERYFDFVIFDEASQVLPEDAVPALMRGRLAVVAGDNKQLPPTTFFATGEEDDYAADEDSATEGFESLLDMMIPFVRQFYLDWHYRSRDEALINFSNEHIYQGRLVTFPGPSAKPVIDLVTVSQELGLDGQEESSGGEVRRVVQLVLEHARTRPTETLGVITMGIKHANRVQAALDRELDAHPDLDEFFDTEQSERFFVKNLERVQGDERDAIIISIGYGKDRAGNLPLRFGPLLSEGGRRRLNVAITRARQRVTVVSSFTHNDIDLSRVRPGSGVELLRSYLQYAASQGKRLGDIELTNVPLNDFEADIFDTLTAQGLRMVPQVGASRFRIDMVAEHPTKPGRMVLAIECDGATYHSSYTARDRDRLRQQQLENLGWRFHRIWSTDWYLRKQDEVKRALVAFADAVKYADAVDNGASSSGTKPNGAKHNGNGAPKRSLRPRIPARPAIVDYTPGELQALIAWIQSDGQLRTDDEIVSEMVSVMGFSRRGVRIETAIRRAIQLWRAAPSRQQ